MSIFTDLAARPRNIWRQDSLAARLTISVALFVYAGIGYFACGLSVDPQRAHSLRTTLDDAIPFIPWTILGYAWVYTAMAWPLFVVKDMPLFRRVATAYFVTLTASFACFVLFPVTSSGFRPALASFNPDNFFEWGARVNFSLDPPYNLFPSLHLSIAALAALSAFKARRFYGFLAFILVAIIAVSICTVKQHFWADGAAGMALALGVYGWLIHPYDARAVPLAARAYTWRGPLLYLALHSTFYLAFVIGFLTR
jgi:hypothetical protein